MHLERRLSALIQPSNPLCLPTLVRVNGTIKDFHVRRTLANKESWLISAVNDRANFSFSEGGLKSNDGSHNEREESGTKVYRHDLDVIRLLEAPCDINTYDQAAYLWKKIGNIPEDRRNSLLELLTPKHVANMWKIAGGWSSSDPATFLLGSQSVKPVSWSGKLFAEPHDPASKLLDLAGCTYQKVFFLSSDGSVYGHPLVGDEIMKKVTTVAAPLYFAVRETREVVATEEACNIAFEYGDGQLHVEVPQDFPKPAPHPWPFNDAAVEYIRYVGPGVVVGQWWIEGKDSKQIPSKWADFVQTMDHGASK